jgi:hypothetical protein
VTLPFIQPPVGAPAHILRFGTVEWAGKYEDIPRRPSVQGGAIFSPCEVYRYVLWRVWDWLLPIWLYGMLNPSKATHDEGDNTVDRQVERAYRNGAGGAIVANSAALRETDRLKAIRHPNPVGPDNLYWIKLASRYADRRIMAFGPDAAKWGGDQIMREAFDGAALHALKITANGSPGHPLYIGYDEPLRPFSWR